MNQLVMIKDKKKVFFLKKLLTALFWFSFRNNVSLYAHGCLHHEYIENCKSNRFTERLCKVFAKLKNTEKIESTAKLYWDIYHKDNHASGNQLNTEIIIVQSTLKNIVCICKTIFWVVNALNYWAYHEHDNVLYKKDLNKVVVHKCVYLLQ